MGSELFYVKSKGVDANAAFASAVAQAEYDHGSSGYTGTIAEKNNFVEVPSMKTANEAMAYAVYLIEEQKDPRFDDKWGPAGCVKVIDDDAYLFFGFASS